MPTGRRLSLLLLSLTLIGTPAAVLRVLCVGSACDAERTMADAGVPFCSLPTGLRRDIHAGFRQGRSPDLMATTTTTDLISTRVPGNVRIPWPGAELAEGSASAPETRVPIAFFGAGISPGSIPPGMTLDSIAPTLETLTGLSREHPEVRSGDSITGLTASNKAGTPLIVLIAWKGLGTPDLERDPGSWPFLRNGMRSGAGSIEARTGSLPLDPAASLTTIGTGALPSSHGITGTLVREDDGDVSHAWSTQEAGSVIATFADDLDRASNERAHIGAILTRPSDRGIIGDGWYLDASHDDPVFEAGVGSRRPANQASTLVTSSNFGADELTDVMGVVLAGTLERVDLETAEVVRTIRGLIPDATFVVAGTGTTRSDAIIDAAELGSGVERSVGASVVQEVAADGLFLDHDVLIEHSITSDRVAEAMRRERSPAEGPLFVDVYPSFAVAFSRYC